MTGGPRRLLVLDRDPHDPKWLFVTVSTVSDVRPAILDDDGRYQQWQQVTDWVRSQFPGPVSLVPVHDALAWTVREICPPG
jgi:hypothetical protein